MVLAGRALCGFCVGIASLSLPVYLGETIQAEVRGTLGLLPTAFGNTGEQLLQLSTYSSIDIAMEIELTLFAF